MRFFLFTNQTVSQVRVLHQLVSENVLDFEELRADDTADSLGNVPVQLLWERMVFVKSVDFVIKIGAIGEDVFVRTAVLMAHGAQT